MGRSTSISEVIRGRKAKGLKPLKARPPSLLYPESIEREYLRVLNAMRKDMLAAVKEEVFPRIERILSEAEKDRPTLDSYGSETLGAIASARILFSRKWNNSEIEKIARRSGEGTSNFNRKEVLKSANRVLGVDVLMQEPWLASEMGAYVMENVDLIKTISDRFFKDVERSVLEGARKGIRSSEIQADIMDRFGVSKSNAERIARDQVGKFNGQLGMLRQNELGIKKFIWSTAGDERVREEHQERDGQTYDWDNPPNGEIPGSPINCRCVALPVFE